MSENYHWLAHYAPGVPPTVAVPDKTVHQLFLNTAGATQPKLLSAWCCATCPWGCGCRGG